MKILLRTLLLTWAAVACHELAVWQAVEAADTPNALSFLARSRTVDDVLPAPVVRERQVTWSPTETAIVICDMWDHHWCQGASARVAEMAPQMNRVVAAARDAGVVVIHAPSSCMEAYRDTPQRQRATSAPDAPGAPEDIEQWCSRLEHEVALPIDDSDGGCDCQPTCPQGSPWKRQIEALKIHPDDAISDSGREIWNLLAERGVRNVALMGVHTNMCVLGRPFGLRQMVRSGKNVVLVRDLTDSMYNSRSAPHVHHDRGTQLVIQHIEEHVCETVLSEDLCGDAPAPHVVMMIGEAEYNTKDTLPQFARSELESRGVRVTLVHVSPDDPDDFSGLEALEEADLLLVSVRRRTPPTEQLDRIRAYLDAGRPMVGIRTASHAFDRRQSPEPGHGDWVTFDIDVLGGDYQGHYGNKPPAGPLTIVNIESDAVDHPILTGFPREEFTVTSHLYKGRDLAATTTVLLNGRIGESETVEPIAWTNSYRGGRVFYTSLGNPADFELVAFRRLLTSGIYWAMERDVPE